MSADIVGWFVTGLITSVVAPALLTATRRWSSWRYLALPPGVACGGFIVLHAVITYALARRPGPAPWLALHIPLLLGALAFWLPVLGTSNRLRDPVRVLYLFLSAPPLDLAAVMVIVLGDQPGGVAMLVGMLPAALIAVAVTWRWMNDEEKTALDGAMAQAADRTLPFWET